jgi:hypothetical protein
VQVGAVRVEAPPPAVTRTQGFGVEVHAAAGGVHVTAPKA